MSLVLVPLQSEFLTTGVPIPIIVVKDEQNLIAMRGRQNVIVIVISLMT